MQVSHQEELLQKHGTSGDEGGHDAAWCKPQKPTEDCYILGLGYHYSTCASILPKFLVKEKLYSSSRAGNPKDKVPMIEHKSVTLICFLLGILKGIKINNNAKVVG